MILGLYFVVASAYVGAWFVSRSPDRPKDVLREGCCTPGLLLPRGMIDYLSMQVELERCGQIWCTLGVFFVFYVGWVLLISWLMEITLFKDREDAFGWGLLLYILIEAIIGAFYCFHLWLRMVRSSRVQLEKYRNINREDGEVSADVMREELDNT